MARKAETTRILRGIFDLQESLREQVELLVHACQSYDAGKRAAAKHMAVNIRVLLHESRMAKGLLEQLGLRNVRFSEWNYTTFPRVRDGKPHKPLRDDLVVEMDVVVGVGQDAKPTSISVPIGTGCRLAVPFTDREDSEYIAPLSSLGREIRKRFPQWWHDEVVRDKKGRVFSRKDLVLHVADTDGGAHVDAALEADYMEFSRRNSLEWKFRPVGTDWKAIPHPHIASIRQIAHELLVTLHRTAAWAFKEEYIYINPIAGREGFTLGSFNLKIVQKKVWI